MTRASANHHPTAPTSVRAGFNPQRLVDLREILRYVPQHRDKIFVIAFDGAVVEHDNFRNLLLDLALLRSLRIGVALVHGAGQQIQKLAQEAGVTPTNVDGTGVTDLATLQLALNAANRVTHEMLEGLSATDLRGACSNAIVAHPAGILQGVDHQHTGRIERVDVKLLKALLDNDVLPVIPPLGCDGDGSTYRLNSDSVAVEVAKALEAGKVIYLTTMPGIMVQSADDPNRGELIRQLTVDEAEQLLRRKSTDFLGSGFSKLSSAVKALRGGVPRVHIIDGTVEEGLLAEVFSNDGIGTLVHTNAYQAIRKALKKDARGIYHLIKTSVENEELLPRTVSEIERSIGDFFVFEVDGNLAGCVALHLYPEEKKAELACVCVSAKYENQGIGARLIQFAEEQSRQADAREVYCLSTQAVNYFVKKCRYALGTPDDLPPSRRQRYDASGRHSQVLRKVI
jgi:amino-acid N-acetyltransferase